MMKTAACVGRAAPRWARSFASVGTQIDTDSSLHLQKARTWDEGVSSNFSTTPLAHIFQGKKIVIFGLPGAFTGVCTAQHVPSFSKHADQFKEKGVDSIICVAVNDPYVMNGWAEKLQCKDKLDFYGDFDGKFHKHLKLDLDPTSALLGPRSILAVVKDKILGTSTTSTQRRLSGAARFLCQASSCKMMREPSMRLREAAAE